MKFILNAFKIKLCCFSSFCEFSGRKRTCETRALLKSRLFDLGAMGFAAVDVNMTEEAAPIDAEGG